MNEVERMEKETLMREENVRSTMRWKNIYLKRKGEEERAEEKEQRKEDNRRREEKTRRGEARERR
jgi:hypothetical protein